MITVLEAFSGIGAQAKALERLNIEHKIIATADWDVNAIMAYDLIHYGKQDLGPYMEMSKQEILKALSRYTLSPNGKNPYKKGALERKDVEELRRLLCAIRRTNNLVSITDMTAKDIPEDLDLLTYSFPCQDLSIAGVWHGNMSGIDRNANNRSGMLWEVERILKECVEKGQRIPRFLLMENVKNIMSPRHMKNFQEWIDYLEQIGYYSKIYKLNASKFGIPQIRERVFLLSVYVGNHLEKKLLLETYFSTNNLEDDDYCSTLPLRQISVSDIIKCDYSKETYLKEADMSQLNDTPSRHRIVEENDKIFQNGIYTNVLKTITTKQDRNPNSGVIEYNNPCEGKINWRYLTARECFLAMGFDECDYEILMEYNYNVAKNRELFSENKLIKMAGNSIVVNVLEAIFMQVMDIRNLLSNSN